MKLEEIKYSKRTCHTLTVDEWSRAANDKDDNGDENDYEDDAPMLRVEIIDVIFPEAFNVNTHLFYDGIWKTTISWKIFEACARVFRFFDIKA